MGRYLTTLVLVSCTQRNEGNWQCWWKCKQAWICFLQVEWVVRSYPESKGLITRFLIMLVFLILHQKNDMVMLQSTVLVKVQTNFLTYRMNSRIKKVKSTLVIALNMNFVIDSLLFHFYLLTIWSLSNSLIPHSGSSFACW